MMKNQNHKKEEERPEQRKHQNYKEDIKTMRTKEEEDQRFERVGEFELQINIAHQRVKMTHTHTHK